MFRATVKLPVGENITLRMIPRQQNCVRYFGRYWMLVGLPECEAELYGKDMQLQCLQERKFVADAKQY